MQKTLKHERNDMVELYVDGGLSTYEIAEIYNISRVAVAGNLKRRGIKLRGAKPKRSVNHNTFSFNNIKDITEEQAYWVGFLMGDGAIIDQKGRNPAIQLTLSNKDRDHVIKFAEFVNSNHKLTSIQGSYSKTPAIRLIFTSKQMAKDLSLFGIVPRKSHIAQVKLLESSKHFWRGIVDADGTVIYRGRKSRIQVVGSYGLMSQLANYLNNKFNTNIHARPHKQIWAVGTANTSATKIIEYLYKNSKVSLKRKNPFVNG